MTRPNTEWSDQRFSGFLWFEAWPSNNSPLKWKTDMYYYKVICKQAWHPCVCPWHSSTGRQDACVVVLAPSGPFFFWNGQTSKIVSVSWTDKHQKTCRWVAGYVGLEHSTGVQKQGADTTSPRWGRVVGWRLPASHEADNFVQRGLDAEYLSHFSLLTLLPFCTTCTTRAASFYDCITGFY